MPYKQTAILTEAQPQLFDTIVQTSGPSTIDNFLTVLDFLFGCWHRHRSRPFTLSGWTYEVCLNCGRKFNYDRAAI